MELKAKINRHAIPLKIGIVGAGFTGTLIAALLNQLSHDVLEIYLFEKSGCFGAGAAYITPFPHHLLNARAKDMSAFEESPTHFIEWLEADSIAKKYLDSMMPTGEQFVPRFLYRRYLQHLIDDIRLATQHKTILKLIHAEVIDAKIIDNKIALQLQDGGEIYVDKVVLATGNHPQISFPFPVSADVNTIANPWDYEAVQRIGAMDSVFIVGTGLSMIDVVLTLHYQHHQGRIHALSRHGLLPLPHAETSTHADVTHDNLPKNLRQLTKYLRKKSLHLIGNGGDWRTVVNALRPQVPLIWQNVNENDKQRFMRHLLPYWNIHRHRVHAKLDETLGNLRDAGQLKIYSGRVLSVDHGIATIKHRRTNHVQQIKVDWLVNCMGPSIHSAQTYHPLLTSLVEKGLVTLDSLNMGFVVSANGALKHANGNINHLFYTLGPTVQGTYWESVAVPEIRKQGLIVAKQLLEA
ncbi:MAG: beta-lactamase protein [uncultured bacterium]|nr:MAG: beta-lactamase protein [uncultured bacterium]